jgi:lysozyme
MPRMTSRQVGGALAVVTLAAGLAVPFESYVNHVYLDPVKVPSYCYGETQNPDWNRKYPEGECRALLEGRLMEFYQGVRSCIKGDMPDTAAAAFTDLAYNMGVGGFCRSSVVRLWNGGDHRAACNRILKFNTAGGVVFKGLTRRREAERELCLRGL